MPRSPRCRFSGAAHHCVHGRTLFCRIWEGVRHKNRCCKPEDLPRAFFVLHFRGDAERQTAVYPKGFRRRTAFSPCLNCAECFGMLLSGKLFVALFLHSEVLRALIFFCKNLCVRSAARAITVLRLCKIIFANLAWFCLIINSYICKKI